MFAMHRRRASESCGNVRIARTPNNKYKHVKGFVPVFGNALIEKTRRNKASLTTSNESLYIFFSLALDVKEKNV